MVAHDPTRPPDPSRLLSAETIARLRDAIAEQWRSSRAESEETQAAILELAREARGRRVFPESLIVLLKGIEADVVRGVPERSPVARRQLTEWLVTTCLRAYFQSEEGGAP